MNFFNIPNLSKELEIELSNMIAFPFKNYQKNKSLKKQESVIIRAGLKGGLESDSVTTDLFWGCLPATKICYGNCFAAKAAFSNGLNFGKHSENILNEKVLLNDLKNIHPKQKFVKNGFNSDPSLNWLKAIEFAKIINQSGKYLIFVTKCLVLPKKDILYALAQLNLELRISISALDSNKELKERIEVIKEFRKLGGTVIPNVITADFSNIELKERQQNLIEFIKNEDLPACENPLRLQNNSPLITLIKTQSLFHVPENSYDDIEVFCGALFREELPIPPYYSLVPFYEKLPSNKLSLISKSLIESIWDVPILTNLELIKGAKPIRSPRMSLILWNK
jgi:hypothetical protein